MPVNLSNHIWLTLVADEQTPELMLAYAGTRILVDDEVAPNFPAPGRSDSLTVLGIPIWGYLREAPGGYEWVMQVTPEPMLVAVQGLPGEQGWTDESQGAVYLNIGRVLLERGNDFTEVASALQALYNAAVTNYVAEQDAP